ncbi:MAG: hypothetical protein AB1758_02405 [Candidatus Eremiobacterota bacterium]
MEARVLGIRVPVFVDRTAVVLDLDRDGEYSPETDAVLAFDMDGDGRVAPWEVNTTAQALLAAGGDYDANRDGRLEFYEGQTGSYLAGWLARQDLDRDGALEADELARLGAQVVRPRSAPGLPERWEPVEGARPERLTFVTTGERRRAPD